MDSQLQLYSFTVSSSVTVSYLTLYCFTLIFQPYGFTLTSSFQLNYCTLTSNFTVSLSPPAVLFETQLILLFILILYANKLFHYHPFKSTVSPSASHLIALLSTSYFTIGDKPFINLSILFYSQHSNFNSSLSVLQHYCFTLSLTIYCFIIIVQLPTLQVD